jgi:HAD superfamily 5'-nucleotidase-like hydrolase
MVVDDLIQNKHYSQAIKKLKFNFQDAIRGLVVDSKNGNILKLSRYGAIRLSTHGTKKIDFNEQNKFYRSTYVDLSDQNYMVIDTSFSIAFCALYGQLVDLKEELPTELPSYNVIALDVLKSVDNVHANGKLKATISEHLDDFVIKDQMVVDGLKHFMRHGKKFFILTNSEYHYTKILLDYAINPFLDPGETWQDLFEYTITLARKPRFFYDNLAFLKINSDTGCMSNIVGPITPGIYQGGCATKFTDDLGLKGDEILYIGDHIYGDILRLKKDCNWRTALVVEELGEEIAAQKKTTDIDKEIAAAMGVKKTLEQDYINIHTQRIDEATTKYDTGLNSLQTEITIIDQQITKLIQDQQKHFNPQWERIFRAGAEESYFAYQVDRYASIYMEKLSDLLNLSPLTYFRANRRLLPHDVD